MVLRGKCSGIKYITEAVVSDNYLRGRGAFYRSRSCTAKYDGFYRNANVGISNDKAGEKPAHRKTKVSWSTLIGSGLVGT